jgi:hypothetical protein
MSKMYPILNDEDWLRDQYVEKRKSMHDIADTVGCSVNPVSTSIHKFGIKPRNPGRQVEKRVEIDEAHAILVAGIMGDGHLSQNGYSVGYQFSNTIEAYVDHVDETLKRDGFGTRRNAKENRSSNRKALYDVHSRSNDSLKELKSRWFPDGERRIPDDFVLTPDILMYYYLDDGSLVSGSKIGNTSSPDRDMEILMSEFKRTMSIEPHINSNGFYFPAEDIDRFFDYIGLPPEDLRDAFAYKWPDDRLETPTP